MSKRILIVDDEKLIVKGLKFSLEQDGYEIDSAEDGGEAFELIKKNSYDVVLLDVMLPVMSGYEVCQAVREFSEVPIIMLTAKSDDLDKIMGLEYGADDYITKPFNILEVKARIKAIMRRSSKSESDPARPKKIRFGELALDTAARSVEIGGNEVNLTAKEYDLLELLIFNPDRVYSREELLSLIWKSDYNGDVRTVDVHVRRLREKIEKHPGEPDYVHTKWGIGYYFHYKD